jgi:hypothetical protein
MPKVGANNSYTEPIFIVGMPRSGTTLLQGILCNSKKYFPMPETHFFSRVAYGLPEKNLSRENREQMGRILKRKSKISVDENVWQRFQTQKEIFEYLIGGFNKHRKGTFLEKTPRHVYFYSQILKHYPDAKFICMIREPRNTVSSLLTMSRKRQKSVIRISLFYNKIANAIIKIMHNRNVLVVKYENLVNQPDQALKNICQFIHLPFDSKLIQTVAAPAEIISEHEAWKNKNVDIKTIQQNDTERWREVFSEDQASLVSFVTKSYASKFDYLPVYSPLAVAWGMMRDLTKFLTPREFKKAFSKYHG